MFAPLKILLAIFAFQKCEGFVTKGYLGQSDLFELSVLHINDFHARFWEIGPYSDVCNLAQEQQCIGGIARVFTASRELLKKRPNAVFLNAGDHFQGTIWYNLFKWNVTADFMNKLPHDAMTIGNHDFDDGIAGLVPFLQIIKSPVVVTNINDTNEPSLKGLYQNSTIIERGGRRIGIIGVIISTTNMLSKTEKLTFLDEVESVNAEAEKLKAQGVEIIIVLSHCGLEIDRKMAEKCPNVDIIVGGHSHTFLYSGEKPYNDDPEDKYPVAVKQKGSNRTVLIVQASAFTRYIGNLTVWFDSQSEVMDWDGNPILLDHSIQEDPEILAALQPWKAEADKQGKKIIGSTNVYLNGKSICQQGECNTGNLITDAMVDYYVGKDKNQTYWTRAAIGVMNSGGIRGSISNDPGSITYEDVIGVQPFENTVDLFELKGSDIIKTLEKAVLESKSPNKFWGRKFLQWSGLKITYNLSNPDYSRLVDVKIRCQACQIPRYENLVPDKWYRLATVSFLLNVNLISGYRNRVVGPQIIGVLVDFISKKSPLIHGTEGRITMLGTWNKQ